MSQNRLFFTVQLQAEICIHFTLNSYPGSTFSPSKVNFPTFTPLSFLLSCLEEDLLIFVFLGLPRKLVDKFTVQYFVFLSLLALPNIILSLKSKNLMSLCIWLSVVLSLAFSFT